MCFFPVYCRYFSCSLDSFHTRNELRTTIVHFQPILFHFFFFFFVAVVVWEGKQRTKLVLIFHPFALIFSIQSKNKSALKQNANDTREKENARLSEKSNKLTEKMFFFAFIYWNTILGTTKFLFSMKNDATVRNRRTYWLMHTFGIDRTNRWVRLCRCDDIVTSLFHQIHGIRAPFIQCIRFMRLPLAVQVRAASVTFHYNESKRDK